MEHILSRVLTHQAHQGSSLAVMAWHRCMQKWHGLFARHLFGYTLSMPHAMQKLAVLSLLAAEASLAAASLANAAASDNRKVDFDYFYLVRQWPATFCNDHYCTHRPPKKYAFTVHGLWPQRRDGTWPEFCDSGSQLNLDDIDDLLADLEKVWPSWSSDDETFWNHEWTRHGTCAEGVIGMQHSFFRAVLRLHSKLNIQDAFSNRGIVPSNYAKYHIQALKHAIDDVYGVMPHITCDQNGQLAEVWMCIDRKLRPIDCVEGPHPHRGRREQGANVPSNFNCNLVRIPKLERQFDGLEQEADSSTFANAGQDVQADLVQTTDSRTSESLSNAAAAVLSGVQQQQQQLPLLITVGMLVAVALVVAAVAMVQLVQYGNATMGTGTAAAINEGSSGRDAEVRAPLLHCPHGDGKV